VAAHELGHHKDWKLNPTKVRNYNPDMNRILKQNYWGTWKDKLSRNAVKGTMGTDALRMETFANREAAKYLKSLGGKDVLGPEAKKLLLDQEFKGKNFQNYRGRPSTSFGPYRYGATMMRRAGLMGLLMALMLPMFMGGKSKE
jgi:hypothetical protein